MGKNDDPPKPTGRPDLADRGAEGGRVAGTPRVLRKLEGRLRIPDDFDAPLPDAVLDAFEGHQEDPGSRNTLV